MLHLINYLSSCTYFEKFHYSLNFNNIFVIIKITYLTMSNLKENMRQNTLHETNKL